MTNNSDDPFSVFDEWRSDADREAFGGLGKNTKERAKAGTTAEPATSVENYSLAELLDGISPNNVPGSDEEVPINAGHFHEALHATYMLATSWEQFVASAPAVKTNVELAEKANRILDEMNSLYLAIGAVDRDEN